MSEYVAFVDESGLTSGPSRAPRCLAAVLLPLDRADHESLRAAIKSGAPSVPEDLWHISELTSWSVRRAWPTSIDELRAVDPALVDGRPRSSDSAAATKMVYHLRFRLKRAASTWLRAQGASTLVSWGQGELGSGVDDYPELLRSVVLAAAVRASHGGGSVLHVFPEQKGYSQADVRDMLAPLRPAAARLGVRLGTIEPLAKGKHSVLAAADFAAHTFGPHGARGPFPTYHLRDRMTAQAVARAASSEGWEGDCEWVTVATASWLRLIVAPPTSLGGPSPSCPTIAVQSLWDLGNVASALVGKST